MKNFSTLLSVIAVSTALQGSHTHFGLKFNKYDHMNFANNAGCLEGKYRFLEYPFNHCEKGYKGSCKTAIKSLSHLIKANAFSYEVFWRVQKMTKYKALLKNLEKRKAQIEELENLSPEDRITEEDVRTIFRKVRPDKSPFDGYRYSTASLLDDETGELIDVRVCLGYGYNSSNGEIDGGIQLGRYVEKIMRCKAFKINKSRPECQYWSNLLQKAQETINDDQKLVDKLQRFSTMKEY